MNNEQRYLILRLTNASLAMDRQGNHNLAELITEAVKEIENGREQATQGVQFGRNYRGHEAE
jgi:hypothetical protein